METDPSRWPSLAGQCARAAELFGDNGFRRVTAWLAEQVQSVDDVNFARAFSDHVSLPGIIPGDYNHRVVESRQGTLLGGIRFYGRDIERPFVEVICHSFADLRALADCVRGEWASFDPPWARLFDIPGAVRYPGAVLDITVFSARCGRMTAPDGRVSRVPFPDPAPAVELVSRRYAAVGVDQPALARNLHAADADDIRTWHAAGQLHAVTVGDTTVGALAVAPGQVLWIDGHEMNEEVILTTHSGYGYAASAQSEWAHRGDVDPEALLVGTIDRLNPASRATALRAGRSATLDGVFIPVRSARSAQ